MTVPEAIAFAGLQAQAEYGDFTDSKRSIDAKPMLPKNFTKSKRMDKKLLEEYRGRIQVEWQGHKHLDEHEAKHQYIKSARSLKTYGVTFFLVKEKMRGKNKMVPRLFGVSKNAVLRLDENTKEVRWFNGRKPNLVQEPGFLFSLSNKANDLCETDFWKTDFQYLIRKVGPLRNCGNGIILRAFKTLCMEAVSKEWGLKPNDFFLLLL